MAIYGQFEGVVTKIASNTTSTQDGTTYYPAIIEIDYNQVNESEKSNTSIRECRVMFQ